MGFGLCALTPSTFVASVSQYQRYWPLPHFLKPYFPIPLLQSKILSPSLSQFRGSRSTSTLPLFFPPSPSYSIFVPLDPLFTLS